jgi:4-alpha-glucanotransferase
MTFGLPSWLKSRYKDLNYEIPIWYPSRDQPDCREWLVTNGLGGYASSTISDAHTRRYHGLLVAALNEPVGRHIILSRVQEQLSLDGTEYDLSTNHWASGVVAPAGYRLIESFSTMPTPVWVYNLDGHYLIKQLALEQESNTVHIAYCWLPDRDRTEGAAKLLVRFLSGFRDFHKEVTGSADKCYFQSVADTHSEIYLDGSSSCLHLSWRDATYEPQSQWWWAYHWTEEAARGLPDQEDLVLTGTLVADLKPGSELSIRASLNGGAQHESFQQAVDSNLARQHKLLKTAALPRSPETNMLVAACDQFLVQRKAGELKGTSVIAGYPWFNDGGREAMLSLPGLTLATRRFEEAKKILSLYASLLNEGMMPDHFSDEGVLRYRAVDPTLWWAWSLYHFYRSTKDTDFLREQFAALKQAAWHYVEGTGDGIKVDPRDGLLRCGTQKAELTWMDALVENIPITPRSGKPVEVCALWHNLLGTLCHFAEVLNEDPGPFANLLSLTEKSMQKFWNDQRQCLFDVLEAQTQANGKPDDTVRPNQLLAISLPFRAFSKLQEKSILTLIENELLTPLGVRSLSPTDPSYQSRYGCGFSRADQYHRDLSYHQGTAWSWLMGSYCDALINVHGSSPETFAKVRILLQPLLNHLLDEGCIGSISEIFDGTTPQTPRGCVAHSMAVAETMRILAWVLRN